MDSLLTLRRSALIYALCIPMAIFMGYLLAQPFSVTSLAFIGLVVGIISLPLLMRWHHALLILTWNASLIVPFLPGQPDWWMCLSFISLAFTILLRIMTKRREFLSPPSVTFWVCFLFVVVMVTATFTGGFGVRALGSAAYGGKRYLYVVCGVIGYFALVTTRIPPEHARFLAVGFFLSRLTAAVCDLAYLLGPKFYFLYYLFPAILAYSQVVGEESSLERFAGLSFGAQAAAVALLARYGVRGVCDWTRLWRLLLVALLTAASMFGGFRSLLILFLFFLAFQFYFERLLTFRNIAILTAVLVMTFVALTTFSVKLPASVQRTLSFLPVSVEHNVRSDATGTAEWRWLMWKTLLPDIPKYFWLGKGFSFSGTDLYLTEQALRRGFYTAYETTLIDGNYHNGILTVVIPFGIWGLIGLCGFLVAAYRVLYLNHRNGDPSLRTVNTLLIAWFTARIIMYFTIFGAFDVDFPAFLGMAGLSLSLNGGVRTADENVARVTAA